MAPVAQERHSQCSDVSPSASLTATSVPTGWLMMPVECTFQAADIRRGLPGVSACKGRVLSDSSVSVTGLIVVPRDSGGQPGHSSAGSVSEWYKLRDLDRVSIGFQIIEPCMPPQAILASMQCSLRTIAVMRISAGRLSLCSQQRFVISIILSAETGGESLVVAGRASLRLGDLDISRDDGAWQRIVLDN